MGKVIENRTWPTHYRGPLLIHASKTFTRTEIDEMRRKADQLQLAMPDPAAIQTGGVADIADVVTAHSSPWFNGPYGWLLQHAKPIAFMPYTGQQRLFRVDGVPASVFQ